MEFEIIIICESFLCPCCKCLTPSLTLERLDSRYVNEELNWLLACEECQQQAAIYYADLWNDYYAGVL